MLTIKEKYDKCKESSNNAMCFFKIGENYQVFEEDAEFLDNFADFQIDRFMGLSNVEIKSGELSKLLRNCIKFGRRVCVIENIEDVS